MIFLLQQAKHSKTNLISFYYPRRVLPSLDMTPGHLAWVTAAGFSIGKTDKNCLKVTCGRHQIHKFFSNLSIVSASAVCLSALYPRLLSPVSPPLSQSSWKTADTYRDFVKCWLVPWDHDTFSLLVFLGWFWKKEPAIF